MASSNASHERLVFWVGSLKVIRGPVIANLFSPIKILLLSAILLCLKDSGVSGYPVNNGEVLLQNFFHEEFSESLRNTKAILDRARRLADLIERGSDRDTSANQQLRKFLDSLASQATPTQTPAGQWSTTPWHSKTTPKDYESSTHKPTCPNPGMPKHDVERQLWNGIEKDSSSMIREAANCGADLEAKNELDFTPLIQAISNGSEHAVVALLRLGARTEERGGKYHQTALHFATTTSSEAVVMDLLSAGANVNALDGFSRTPLHWAAWIGSPYIARSLVEAGAEVNLRESSGYTPLGLAIAFGQHSVKDYLESIGGHQ